MLDSELVQLAELQAVSRDARLASAAVWKLAAVADAPHQPDLLLKAIKLSPGNLRAWQAITALIAQRKLDTTQLDAFTTAIEKYAVPHNGPFAFEMYLAVVQPRGTIQQLPLLDRAAKWFTGQPEVLARVKLEEGRARQKLKRPDLAMAAYRDAIDLQPRCSPIVLEGFQHIDALYRANKDLPDLIALYAIAWPRLDRPRPSPHSRTVPYVLIGQLYRQALEDAGRQREAQQVQIAIDNLQLDRN
jgi:hypothetical protein